MPDFQQQSDDSPVAVSIVQGLPELQCLNQLIYILCHILIMEFLNRAAFPVSSGIRCNDPVTGSRQLFNFPVENQMRFTVAVNQHHRAPFSHIQIAQPDATHYNFSVILKVHLSLLFHRSP